MKNEFATPRRTVIIDQEGEVEDEDLNQREDMVVTVSHAGYVKRVPLSAYRAQKRGGKGRSGMQTRDEGFRQRLFIASTHTPVLFFSSRGAGLQGESLASADGRPNSRGKAMINILPLEQGERITTIMPLPEDESVVGQSRRAVRHHRRQCPAQQAVRFRGCAPLRHHCHEAGGCESIVDVQIATESDDVVLTAAAASASVSGLRRARVLGPHIHGCAWHRARRRRQADFAHHLAASRGFV